MRKNLRAGEQFPDIKVANHESRRGNRPRRPVRGVLNRDEYYK
jgi:hypothetical protein